jgi:hypothetical protein
MSSPADSHVQQQGDHLGSYYEAVELLRDNPNHPAMFDLSLMREVVGLAEVVGDPLGLLEYFSPYLRFLELHKLGRNSAALRGAVREMVRVARTCGLELFEMEYFLAVLETLADANEVFDRHEGEAPEIDDLIANYENLTVDERRDLERQVDRQLREARSTRCKTKRTRQALQRQMFPRRVLVIRVRPRRTPHRAARHRSVRRAHVGSGGGDDDGDGPPGDSDGPGSSRRGRLCSLLGACGVAPARPGRPRDLASTARSEERASSDASGLGHVGEVHFLRPPGLRRVLAAALPRPPFSGAGPRSGRRGS